MREDKQMSLSRSITAILTAAAETSAVDEAALNVLGSRILSAIIVDPETPQRVRTAAALLLNRSNHDPSSTGPPTPVKLPE